MLSLALPVEIYFCTQATDMRRGFDGLLRMAEERLSRLRAPLRISNSFNAEDAGRLSSAGDGGLVQTNLATNAASDR